MERTCSQAIQLWAEYVLPSARPDFWSAFVARLEAVRGCVRAARKRLLSLCSRNGEGGSFRRCRLQAGQLKLFEGYLPFHDRSLLPPDVYARALNAHLQNHVSCFTQRRP